MIDIELVCGYLGAGKTTWLRHRLSESEAGSTSIVVNDFAEVGTDASVLTAAGRNVVHSISGGCICCDRLTDLVRILHREVDRQHRTTSRNENHRIVVEASGVTQPGPIFDLVRNDPVLKASIRRLSLTTLIDGVDGAASLRHRPEVRSAARMADRVVVSRADISDQVALAEIMALVRGLSPLVPISTSASGHERPWTATVSPEESPEASDEVGAYASWTAELASTTRWSELAFWLHAVARAHPDEVTRLKGTIKTDRLTVAVHTMGRVVDVRPAADGDGPAGVLTGVLRNLDPATLSRSLRDHVPSSDPLARPS